MWEPERSERNIGQEEDAFSIEKGDVLFICPLTDEAGLPEGRNSGEICDLDFASCKDGVMLPVTPFHDHAQDLILMALLTSDESESSVCVVRDTDSNGGEE